MGQPEPCESSLAVPLRWLPGWFAWSSWLGRCSHPYSSVSASSHGFPHRRGSFFGVRPKSYCSYALLLGPPVTLSWSCLILTCHGVPQLRYFRGLCCSWHRVLTTACRAPSVASAAFASSSELDLIFFSEPVSVPYLLNHGILLEYSPVAFFPQKFAYEILKQYKWNFLWKLSL